MAEQGSQKGSVHDLVGAALGVCAFGILISSPWNVDTSGPEPFYKGPLLFPIMVLGLMIAASLPSMWRLLRNGNRIQWSMDGRGIPYKTLGTLFLLIAFLAAVPWIGLELSTLIFLGISLWMLGHRTLGKGVILPLVVTAILWLVFKELLGVFFPTPRLLEMIVG